MKGGTMKRINTTLTPKQSACIKKEAERYTVSEGTLVRMIVAEWIRTGCKFLGGDDATGKR